MCFWQLHWLSQQIDENLSRKTKEDKKNFIFEKKSFALECFYGHKDAVMKNPSKKLREEAETFQGNVRFFQKKILQRNWFA